MAIAHNLRKYIAQRLKKADVIDNIGINSIIIGQNRAA